MRGGFTDHNHRCGIDFLSHLKGAPQKPTPIWDHLGCGGIPRRGVARVITFSELGFGIGFGTKGDPWATQGRPSDAGAQGSMCSFVFVFNKSCEKVGGVE